MLLLRNYRVITVTVLHLHTLPGAGLPLQLCAKKNKNKVICKKKKKKALPHRCKPCLDGAHFVHGDIVMQQGQIEEKSATAHKDILCHCVLQNVWQQFVKDFPLISISYNMTPHKVKHHGYTFLLLHINPLAETQCTTPDPANQGLQEQLHTEKSTGEGLGFGLDFTGYVFFLNLCDQNMCH